MGTFRNRHEGAAKLAERTVRIVIDPAAAEALDALRARIVAMAAQPSTATLAGDPIGDARREYEHLRAKVAAEAVEFRMRGLPRRQFTALKLEHPPREGNRVDEQNDVHFDAFSEALLRRCAVAPEMDDDDWAWLIGDGTDDNPGVLTSAQYDKLVDAAWSANRRDVEVPLLLAASDEAPTSADE